MEDVLDQTRGICKRGVLPTGRLVSSFGAVEYQTVNSTTRGSIGSWGNVGNVHGSVHDDNTGNGNGNGSIPGSWSWDTDFSPPSTSTSPRKLRSPTTITTPKSMQVTSLPHQLLPILGSLLQEYTTLPSIPYLSRAQSVYPQIFRNIFSLYRMTAVIYANVSEEIPVRLVNDSFYLAGEIGLMGVGMEEMGFMQVGRVLAEISEILDMCGIGWREKYLVSRSFYHFFWIFFKSVREMVWLMGVSGKSEGECC